MVDEACLCLPAGTHLIQASRPYGKKCSCLYPAKEALEIFHHLFIYFYKLCDKPTFYSVAGRIQSLHSGN